MPTPYPMTPSQKVKIKRRNIFLIKNAQLCYPYIHWILAKLLVACPLNRDESFLSSIPCPYTFLVVAILAGVRGNLNTALFCNSLKARDPEHFKNYLLTTISLPLTPISLVHWVICWLVFLIFMVFNFFHFIGSLVVCY